jgi:hypothetical protein
MNLGDQAIGAVSELQRRKRAVPPRSFHELVVPHPVPGSFPPQRRKSVNTYILSESTFEYFQPPYQTLSGENRL